MAATRGSFSPSSGSASARRRESLISPIAPRRICARFSPAAGRKESTAARCSARSRLCGRSRATSPAKAAETAAALGAIRAPKAARRLPRPLSAPDARAVTTTAPREGEAREQWVLARDAAVLALCYGAGLRISRGPVDPSRRRAGRRGGGDHHRRQRREVALGADHRAGAQGRRGLPCALPLCAQTRRAAVRRRERRPACRRASCNWRWRGCAARSACPTARRRMRCAIRSPPICSRAAAICARSRTCSATPRCRRRKSTPASTARGCSPPTAPLIRACVQFGAWHSPLSTTSGA